MFRSINLEVSMKVFKQNDSNGTCSDAIKGLGCDILLVGINYDKEAPTGKRKHGCVIERLDF